MIEAQHGERMSILLERDLLRILLRKEKTGDVSFRDGCQIQQILEKHPEFAVMYGLTIKRKL